MQKLKKQQHAKAMKASRHGLLPPLAAPLVGTSKKEIKESPRGEIDEEEGEDNTHQTLRSDKPQTAHSATLIVSQHPTEGGQQQQQQKINQV